MFAICNTIAVRNVKCYNSMKLVQNKKELECVIANIEMQFAF